MILLIAGTNRLGSNTLKVAQSYSRLYSEKGIKNEVLSLEEMPAEAFQATAYEEKPEAYQNLAQKVLDADGLHVFTPEYNGGFPGVLKYFIDLLPFPESFENRPVAFTGLAAGMWGALRPVEQLEGVFKYRNALLFNERVFLPKVHEQIDEDGNFTHDFTKKLIDSQITNYASFIEKLKS